jgi:integrase
MATRPSPILRFQDVLPGDITEYLAYLGTRTGRNGEIASSTKSHYLSALNLLYDKKELLGDSIRFRPTGNKSPDEVTGHRNEDALQNRTKAIPDDELKAIINAALEYVQTRAAAILKCLEEFVEFAKHAARNGNRRQIRYRYYEVHFFATRNDFQSAADLSAELVQLRTACFIIVVFSTGMRLSEILAMKRGCVRQEKTANHGTFFWIDSRLYKTQKLVSGAPRAWMCGPLAAQAVEALERLCRILNVKTKYLFADIRMFITVIRTKGSKVRLINRFTAGHEVKKFCAALGIRSDIHTHRFRRSFARNIIRFSSTSILALREHFKHWSIYMTDWYVGVDPELIEDLEAERRLLSIEAMEKIFTQPVSGAGGRKWTKELEQRIQDGRLPRNFKGKAGLEFRKTMISGLHDSGMIVVPCGNFTHCVFQQDRALCNEGDRPIPNRCNPTDCPNSYITEEHIPAHRKKLSDLERLYSKLNEEGKKGPAGMLYMREIRKTRKALEPFEDK